MVANDTRNGLTIQQMVERTGVSAPTLRFDERVGLLGRVARDASAHRRYLRMPAAG